MSQTNVTNFRIIDTRQSKQPGLFRVLLRTGVFVAILFVPGLLFQSAAMQWTGFAVILFLLGVFIFMLDTTPLTIDEAIEELEKMKAED